MNNVLRLGFTDIIKSIENFFIHQLSKKYQVIRDDENPDYLIFSDGNFGNNNAHYNNKNCIKIFYTGENERPWNYQCHYSISFEHDTFDGRNFRLPLYVIYDHDNHYRDVPNTSTISRSKEDLLNPKKFCSFVVKNPGSEKRNQWFHKLSSYKFVSSGGPLYNNIGYVLSRGDDGIQEKIKFLNNHKFNLCFENSSYPGYATEKLYEALCSKTIPIYWGSPTIECDFNSKAFLNWNDYQDDDLFLEAIKKIDQNNDLYEEMFFQPMFSSNTKRNKFFDMELFLNWFDKTVYKGVINNR
jgi:hypothetical protein